MRTKYVLGSLLLALLVLASSCGERTSGGLSGGDTIKMKYAQHIVIVRHDGYKVVELQNPWKSGTLLHRYVLVDRKDSARLASNQGQMPEGTIVYTPIRRAVVFSSPHCSLLALLGASEAIRGVCDLSYINLPFVHEAVRKGNVTDCGNSMSPTVERIVHIGADALLVSPFDGVGYGQMETLGIPLVECADYMETSALGRAEWMKFYGMLVGEESRADSLFAVVEKNYMQLRALARSSKQRPKVITERVVSGVWYCPGGKSSMGRLLADANVRYAFASDEHSGSLTLSPEVVLSKASDADVWMFVASGGRAIGKEELLSEYAGYKMMRAFQKGMVLQCLPSMENPYFEEVSFRPDLLLQNLVALLHPDLHFDSQRHYYVEDLPK